MQRTAHYSSSFFAGALFKNKDPNIHRMVAGEDGICERFAWHFSKNAWHFSQMRMAVSVRKENLRQEQPETAIKKPSL